MSRGRFARPAGTSSIRVRSAPQDLSALERNGVVESLADLEAHQLCLSNLANVSMLARGLHDGRSAFGINLSAPKIDPHLELEKMSQRFEASAKLLPPAPAARFALPNLGILTMLASSLATIRQSFGVDLLKPAAINLLQNKVGALNAAGLGRVSLPSIPQAYLAKLTSFAQSTQSLNTGIGVNLLRPQAGAQLKTAMTGFRASGLLAALRTPPFNPSTLARIGDAHAWNSSMQIIQSSFGIDLLQGAASPALSTLTVALAPGGSLASLSMMIAEGSLGSGPQFSLPPIGVTAVLQSIRHSLDLSRSALGLDLLKPDAGAKLRDLMMSLQRSGACEAAAASALTPADANGLSSLQAATSCMDNTKAPAQPASESRTNASIRGVVKGIEHNSDPPATATLAIPTGIVRNLTELAAIGSMTARLGIGQS